MVKTKKTSYLVKLNINIYAETVGGDQMYDHHGCAIIAKPKGSVLELPEETFENMFKYGGISMQTTTNDHYENTCQARIDVEDIASIETKTVSTVFDNFDMSIQEAIDKFQGREKPIEVACSKELDLEFANESENIQ